MDTTLEWIDGRPYEGRPIEGNSENLRFALVRRLGQGGTGEVHEGLLMEASGRKRRVTVKILDSSLTTNRQVLDQLTYATQGISHPHIVTPIALLDSEIGYVLVSDYIEGFSVADLQRRLKVAGRRLPPALALEIVSQTLEQLIFLQATKPAQCVHNDIKPSNLLVGIDGRVRLLDLGLANPLMAKGTRNRGLAVVSVLPYMAPEQLSDHPRSSPTTDLYCLATVVYELLARRPLFDGSPARRELEIRVGFGIQDKTAALDAVIPGIGPVLSKALSLAEHDRYASAAAMFTALAPLRAGPCGAQLAALVQELKSRPQLLPNPTTQPARAAGAVTTVPMTSSRSAGTTRRPASTPGSSHTRRTQAKDLRLKMAVGAVGLAVALAALLWVDRPHTQDPRPMTVSERAMKPDPEDTDQQGSFKPAGPPADQKAVQPLPGASIQ